MYALKVLNKNIYCAEILDCFFIKGPHVTEKQPGLWIRVTLLEHSTDDAIVTKFSTISLFLNTLYVT